MKALFYALFYGCTIGLDCEVIDRDITGLLHLADRSCSDLRLDPLGSDNREYLLCWEWGERV